MEPQKQGWCPVCRNRTTAQLSRKEMTSGAYHYCYACTGCGKINPFKDGPMWITSDKVEEAFSENGDWLTFPTIPAFALATCARCGSPGAENHHWAPKAMFGEEAELWPQDYLCKTCHDLWHGTVTPQLVPGE